MLKRLWLPGLLLLVVLMLTSVASETAVADPPPRQINIFPFEYGPDEEWAKTSIFWFGEAEYPGQGRNYVDVRVAYSQSNFLVNILVVDYYLWLDTNPQPADDLTQYDAVALYLDTQFDRAAAPQNDDFLFLVGQHNSTNYVPYLRDARGSGSGWNYGWVGADWRGPVGLDYSTGGPNNNGGNIDFGWTARFVIPWSDLGLSGPPSEGTQWGFGVRLYDRDDQPPAGGIPVQSWPETFQPNSPATWAALHYGHDAYVPGPGSPQGSTTIRAQSATDNTVQDAWMGGGGLCASGHEGGTEINHGNHPDLYTGSEIRPTHFPCFNKSFLRFNLNAIPAGKEILSAELTLHLDGHAGETPDLARPSWVSLFHIRDSWQEMTIHWNNAPLAYENIDAIWVYPYSGNRNNPIPPGDPYTWDATKAVAEAYASGIPVDLALYGSDTAQHSSKYFHSSEVPVSADPNDPMRDAAPTLVVTWGNAGATVHKRTSTPAPETAETVTYELQIVGSGEALSLVDVLPAGVTAPFSMSPGLSFAGGEVTWSGTPSLGEEVVLSYAVTVTAESGALRNVVTLFQGGTAVASDLAIIIVNAEQIFLPMILRP